MRRIYIIPNIITAFGLACGLFVIFKMNMIEPGMGTYQVLQTSAILLLLAAFADWVDGAVARAMHAVSEFGFLFDSLADAVTFGVAPSVLLLKSLSLEQGTGLSFFAVCGAMLYSICGVLRLVRFNVKANQAKTDPKLEEAYKKHFTGLPIPAAALAAVAANLLLASPFADQYFEFSLSTKAIILTCLMIALGYFMISRFKFPSAKVLHFRVQSFYLVFFTVIIALFALYGVLYFFPVTLAVFSWSYVIIGWVIAIIRVIAGKKSKTLEDFEPEDQEDE
ncbi:MAG TPA: CDP-alcohol phosphatidyltransferase family protein [Rhabdochlamydiaceae bacterium]|nr:CDP-alcohol phosphatidyltransferase family protein [Rhabdochlamydiaceae bacterium]